MALPEYEKPPTGPVETLPSVTKISIGEAKTMGFVGAILNLVGLLAGAATGVGAVLTIVGIILIYVGVSRLSDKVKDPRPRKYYLNYLIFGIIAIVIAIIGLIAALGALIFSAGAGLIGGLAGLLATLGIVIVVFIITYVLLIIASMNLRKSYDIIKTYTKIDMFGTAGFLYFLGAILLIILVGGIILFIAVILELIAWASLPDTIELPSTPGKEPSPVQTTPI